MDSKRLLELDRQHVWHPYASFLNPIDCYPVASANGCLLKLCDGRELIDGMSSWWCAIHGYNHPRLNRAIEQQVGKMSHVMFGGLSHQPAVELAALLCEITPKALNKVFFADSGSVSVEVAIKMALQYWHSQGKPSKTRMLAFRHGYHGDTFAAMSVCDPVNGMHHLFQANLMDNLFAEAPNAGFDCPPDPQQVTELEKLFTERHQEIAAFIFEPVVQGAGGMRFYHPQWLYILREFCNRYQVLLIADEIATGFGRSGELFACEHASISPDILCLGKALTGGYMTLAATLCNDKVSDGICRGEAGVFMHGPTFMANPLACATALESTRLLLESDWKSNVKRIEQGLILGLSPCAEMNSVADVRCLGAIGVIEMKEAVEMKRLQAMIVERGIWVRPFGKLVYLMPPFVISDYELSELCRRLCAVLKDYSACKG